jgi:hypothetical protein
MITWFLDRIKSVYALASTTLTATTETSTAAVARTGYTSALVIVKNGVSAGNTLTLKLYDGATSSPVTAVTLNGTPVVIDCTAVGQTLYQIDLNGFNAYFKATVTPSTSTSVTFDVDILLVDAILDPGAGTGSAVTPLAKA